MGLVVQATTLVADNANAFPSGVAGIAKSSGHQSNHSNKDNNSSAAHQAALLSQGIEDVITLKNDRQSNANVLGSMSGGSRGENPFEEWTKPGSDVRPSNQLEMFMKQARPSVYNLPHNPMNHRSFKCNYIKSRVETTRMDYVSS